MSYSGAKGYPNKPKPGVFINPLHPLSRGLVGMWLFNEGAGSQLSDISVKNNHGTLTNMNPANDWVGSLHGGALDFDGTDDYVVTNVSPNVGNGDFTLSAWVNLDAIGGTDDNFIRQDGGSPRRIYLLRYDEGTSPDVFSMLTFDGSIQQALSTTSPETNRWYHVLGTRTKVPNELKIYVDGVLEATATGTTADLETGAAAIYFGTDPNGLPSFVEMLDGQLSDVSIWNRALSASEARQLFNDPYANLLTPVMRRYSIEEAVVSGFIPKVIFY